jgi:peptidoglycan/xylan/chitin deacetylase (PgdA/CDA1 family)
VIIAFLLALVQTALGESWIRVNQLGYLPQGTKVAVLVSTDTAMAPHSFELRDRLTDQRVWRSDTLLPFGPYGPFRSTYRLDFTGFTQPGAYVIHAEGVESPPFRVAYNVYEGTADFLLRYMRQQRCGYNPFLEDSCHARDGYIIYHPEGDSSFVDVRGGWHDASDYLQYVTTSANAVVQMLHAFRENPAVFSDRFDADGSPAPNGIPDIVDEARWGIDWLMKMNPRPGIMFNQIADDRDHLGFRLPTEDTVDYGFGRGRPLYFCTGEPQGIKEYKNRTTGIASTAGKFASAFALAAMTMEEYFPELIPNLTRRARMAFQFGEQHPGVCQTAPCRAPYFYEEENWVDDMELAALLLHQLTGEEPYLQKAVEYGGREPVTPWMGATTARHYQWYPFVNLGHAYLSESGEREAEEVFEGFLREGIRRVYRRGSGNAFCFGVPFIWCSNNLVSAMLTQLRLHASAAQDDSCRIMEAMLRDWLFGCNPWGTSMVVGLPPGGVSPKDPHSAFTHVYGYEINGGLVDGPVYGSIFRGLKGIHLSREDAFREFQSDLAVYHDDWGDYSTNEPTMDGTASLSYYLSSMETEGMRQSPVRNTTKTFGGITRMDTSRAEIYIAFTGHEFAEGGEIIREALRGAGVKASFFFTGDFYRNPDHELLVEALKKEGHYLGAHSGGHILYADWGKRDSLLVTRAEFEEDLKNNFEAMHLLGISATSARYFMPPYEWYNNTISGWCEELGLTLVNFTPGTYANADYTTPDMGDRYRSSAQIYRSILRYEERSPSGLNGAILLMHIGTHPSRTDKFYLRLAELLAELKARGYGFGGFTGN